MVQCFGKGKVYFVIADFLCCEIKACTTEVKLNMANTLKEIFPDLPSVFIQNYNKR